MATPFDATTKVLVDLGPEDWLRLFDLPFTTCAVSDSDLATVSTEAERLIEVQASQDYVAHIEFQTGHDGAAIPERLLRYNGIALAKTERPVLSFVILLRREADSPRITGTLEVQRPNGSVYLRFEYGVLRLWQIPVATILAGGLTTLPLALLADLSGTTPSDVVAELDHRLQGTHKTEYREELWTATYLLSGLRFEQEESNELLKGVVAQMRESSTYQAILEEGHAKGRELGKQEGERNALILVAKRRLGMPDTTIQGILDHASLERLQAWLERVTEVESWQELLAN